MARSSSTRSRKSARKPTSRARWWLFAPILLVALLAPFADRALWRRGEASSVSDAFAAYEAYGCSACHGSALGSQRWRQERTAPPSVAEVQAAIAGGRDLAPGFPAAMPAYGKRINRNELERLTSAVMMLTGGAAYPDDPELQVGMEIARESGCFACHGPLGAGGVVNRYARGGEVPGFYGASFRKAVSKSGGLETIIRKGRVAKPAWWMPWRRPALVMPAYSDRLDSVEMGLVTRYVQWLTSDVE